MITTLAQAFDEIANGSVDAVRDYVLSHAEVINAKTYFLGGTLLHYAAARSNPEMIQALVAVGFEVNKPGASYGDMPLHSACRNGMYENAKLLLSLGAEIDVSASHRNPLFGAIIGSSPRIVQLLLEAGMDPSIEYKLEDGSVVNALGFARKRGETECERVLLGAEVFQTH